MTSVNGNFQITSTGSGNLELSSDQNYSLNVAGNFIVSGGIFNLKTATAGSTTINIGGNLTYSGGTIDVNSNCTATLNLNGAGVQTFSRTAASGFADGAPTDRIINMSIASGSTVDMGTSSFNGNGNFTLNSTATLRTGNASGLNGSLQNTGTKTFNANSTLVYNGTVAQVMGTLYPGAPPAGLNVTINNASGVTTSTPASPATTITSITGNLNLLAGNLNVGAGHALQLDGTLSRTSGNIVMNPTGSLTVNGSGALGVSPFPFSGAQTFANFTLNRSSSNITLGNNVTLTGNATLTDGTLALEANQLTLSGNYAVTGGLLSGTSSSVLTIDGAGTTNTLNFAGGGNILGSLNVNRGGATVSFGGNFTLVGNLNVTAGTLSGNAITITMQGSSWNINGGTFSPGNGTVTFDGTTTVPFTTSFNNINLNASRTLTFPASTINIAGAIIFSSTGTFNHGNGTILLNGSTIQNFNGGDHDFYNITVNKAGGDVSLSGPVNLVSVLTIQSGTDFQSGGQLTLLSTNDSPDVSASIAPLTAINAQVSGDVTVQRYMSGEGRIYRYLSVPVTTASVAHWKSDFAVTGTFSDPSTVDPVTGEPAPCGVAIKPSVPSLYYYNEAVLGPEANGWVAYPSSGLASAAPLVLGRGYAPFIRQCTNPTLVDVTGLIHQGDFTFPVTRNQSAPPQPNADGYNLIGNPYPSSIQWAPNGSGWVKSNNISATAAIRDNGSGGAFVYIDETDINNIIASGQAFWITVNSGPAPVLTIQETAKTSTNNVFYRESNDVRNLLEIQVMKDGVIDRSYFRIKPEATNDYDRHDFPKLDNALFDVAILHGQRQLAVNAIPELPCESVLPLHIKDMTNGTYSFNVSREGIFVNTAVYLVDRFTNATVNLTENGPYEFAITSTAASKASNRFELKVEKNPVNALVAVDGGNGVLCSETSYKITLPRPQPFVQYVAEINGTPVTEPVQSESPDASLIIHVPAHALSNGNNIVIMRGSTPCSSVLLEQQVSVVKESLALAAVAPATVCNGGTATLTASGAPANGTYLWYASEAGGEPLAEGASFTTPNLTTGATYFVAAVNGLGCEGARVPVKVELQYLVEAQISVQSRTKIRSNYASGNQWYWNGTLLSGETKQHLTIKQPGIYTVVVTVNGCTTQASYEYQKIHASDESPLAVYPNPVTQTDELHVEFIGPQPASVRLLNAMGMPVQEIQVEEVAPETWKGEVAAASLARGVYFVRIEVNGRTHITKVLLIP